MKKTKKLKRDLAVVRETLRHMRPQQLTEVKGGERTGQNCPPCYTGV